jgi:hypothetical protein
MNESIPARAMAGVHYIKAMNKEVIADIARYREGLSSRSAKRFV